MSESNPYQISRRSIKTQAFAICNKIVTAALHFIIVKHFQISDSFFVTATT